MANRLFQSVIHQMKDAVDKVIGVIDEHATVIACSELGRMGETLEMSSDAAAPGEVFVSNGVTFKAIGSNMASDYYVFVYGKQIAFCQCTVWIIVKIQYRLLCRSGNGNINSLVNM